MKHFKIIFAFIVFVLVFQHMPVHCAHDNNPCGTAYYRQSGTLSPHLLLDNKDFVQKWGALSNLFWPDIQKGILYKINNGSFRQVYSNGQVVFKTINPYTEKRFLFIPLLIPTKLYTRYLYGVDDLNAAEYHNYQALLKHIPVDLADSFAKILTIIEHNNEKVLVGELITDADGTISPTLKQHDPVSNDKFWTRLDCIEQFILSNNIPYMDIGPNNLAVKTLANGNSIPVIIDHKAIGINFRPFQLDLKFKSMLRRKIKRKFQRLRQNFKPITESPEALKLPLKNTARHLQLIEISI